MPHVTIEYSANLENQIDIQNLCTALHGAMMQTGIFELGAVRVRAFKAQCYAITDLDPRNGFADISVRIGAGRSQAERKAVGESVNEAAKASFAALLAQSHFALSVEVREIDPQLSWKTNAMHARLRKNGEENGPA